MLAELAAHIDARIARAVSRFGVPIRRLVIALVDAARKAPELAGEGLGTESLADVELFQHTGFRSIPVGGAEAILVQVGGPGGHWVAVATADRTTAPVDVLAGEALLYGSGGARVHARLGGLVVLNEGVAGAARLGDPVSVTLDATALTAIVTTLTNSGLITPGSPTGAPLVPVPVSGTIVGASATVLVG